MHLKSTFHTGNITNVSRESSPVSFSDISSFQYVISAEHGESVYLNFIVDEAGGPLWGFLIGCEADLWLV